MFILLLDLVPIVLGLIAAGQWWFLRGRADARVSGLVAVLTLTAGVVGVLAETVTRLVGGPLSMMSVLPRWVITAYMDYRIVVPLLVGALGLALLALPPRTPQEPGTADLSPRGIVSFTSKRWLVAVGAITALVLVVTVAAGAASQPNPATGNYDYYVMDLGGDYSVATTIYGWYYSVPMLAAMAVVLGLAASALLIIAGPPLGAAREEDVRVRCLRSHNVLAVTCGALLLHLAAVLESLRGTASLRGMIPSDAGSTTVWTPMAAAGPWFGAAAFISATLGVAAWARVAFSAARSRATSSAAVS